MNIGFTPCSRLGAHGDVVFVDPITSILYTGTSPLFVFRIDSSSPSLIEGELVVSFLRLLSLPDPTAMCVTSMRELNTTHLVLTAYERVSNHHVFLPLPRLLSLVEFVSTLSVSTKDSSRHSVIQQTASHVVFSDIFLDNSGAACRVACAEMSEARELPSTVITVECSLMPVAERVVPGRLVFAAIEDHNILVVSLSESAREWSVVVVDLAFASSANRNVTFETVATSAMPGQLDIPQDSPSQCRLRNVACEQYVSYGKVNREQAMIVFAVSTVELDTWQPAERILLIQVDLLFLLSPLDQPRQQVVGFVELGRGLNVTAMAFDVFDDTILLGTVSSVLVVPSSILRVRLARRSSSLVVSAANEAEHEDAFTPLALLSTFDFSPVGLSYPIVTALRVDDAARLLYATAASEDGVEVLLVNLFGLEIVEPQVIDRYGGATISFIGTGFPLTPAPVCLFTDDSGLPAQVAAATVVSSRLLLCSVPLSYSRDTFCIKSAVNMRAGGRLTATTNVRLVRAMSATVMDAWTSAGHAVVVRGRGPELTLDVRVTVVGYGFVGGASRAVCRVEDNSNGNAVMFVMPLLVFINTTMVVCAQPEGAISTRGTVLRYSHDGSVFSDSFALYAVLGAFASVRLRAQESYNQDSDAFQTSVVSVIASRATHVPTLKLELLDGNGNALGAYAQEEEHRDARCSFTSPLELTDSSSSTSSTTLLNKSAFAAPCVNGEAFFPNIVVSHPVANFAAPSFRVFCFLVMRLNAYDVVDVFVIPGTPAGMRLSPDIDSAAMWRAGVTEARELKPSPAVVFVDEAGNRVVDASSGSHLSSLRVTLQYRTRTPLSLADPENPSSFSSAPLMFSGKSKEGSRIAETVVTRIGVLDPLAAQFVFSGVMTQSEFGAAPVLVFYAALNSFITGNITDAQSFPPLLVTVRQEACSPDHFAIEGTFQCQKCPAPLASCDGSSTVEPAPGTWRSTARASAALFQCSPQEACANMHTAGADGTACAEGYEGFRCAACGAHFAKEAGVDSRCARCPSALVSWSVVAALVIALALAVYALSLRSIPFSSVRDTLLGLDCKKPQPVISLLVKILVSHIQCVALVPAGMMAMPAWVTSSVAVAERGSGPTVQFLYVTCVVGQTVRKQLSAVGCLLVLLLLLFAAVSYVVAWLNSRRYLRLVAQLTQSPLHAEAACSWVAAQMEGTADGSALGLEKPKSKREAKSALVNSVSKHQSDFIDSFHVFPEADLQRVNDLLNGVEVDESHSNSSTSQERTSRAAALSPILERFVNIFSVACVVVLFFVYPTVVKIAVAVFRCQEFWTDTQHTETSRLVLVAFDMRTRCDDEDSYGPPRTLAVLMLTVVGVGALFVLPGMVIGVEKWLEYSISCASGPTSRHLIGTSPAVLARRLFHFATGGYRLWFWESISMSRKAALACAMGVTVVSSPSDSAHSGFQLPLLYSAWIVAVYIVVHAVAVPWSLRCCQRLELVSLTALLATYMLLALVSADGSGVFAETGFVLMCLFNGAFVISAAAEIAIQWSSSDASANSGQHDEQDNSGRSFADSVRHTFNDVTRLRETVSAMRASLDAVCCLPQECSNAQRRVFSSRRLLLSWLLAAHIVTVQDLKVAWYKYRFHLLHRRRLGSWRNHRSPCRTIAVAPQTHIHLQESKTQQEKVGGGCEAHLSHVMPLESSFSHSAFDPLPQSEDMMRLMAGDLAFLFDDIEVPCDVADATAGQTLYLSSQSAMEQMHGDDLVVDFSINFADMDELFQQKVVPAVAAVTKTSAKLSSSPPRRNEWMEGEALTTAVGTTTHSGNSVDPFQLLMDVTVADLTFDSEDDDNIEDIDAIDVTSILNQLQKSSSLSPSLAPVLSADDGQVAWHLHTSGLNSMMPSAVLAWEGGAASSVTAPHELPSFQGTRIQSSTRKVPLSQKAWDGALRVFEHYRRLLLSLNAAKSGVSMQESVVQLDHHTMDIMMSMEKPLVTLLLSAAAKDDE